MGNLFFAACGILSIPAFAIGSNWFKANPAPQPASVASNAQLAHVGHVRPASLSTTGTGSTANENESFTYDSVGRVLTANNGFAQISYTYDSIGRRSSMTQTVGGVAKTVNFTYDTANRLISRSIVGAETETRTYTSRNQIETIRLDGELIVTFTYDAVGREISRIYGNGVVTNSGFARADNMITSIDVPNKPELSFTYNYDSNKNVTGETRGGTMSNASWAATFDEMDRINSQNGVGPAPVQHSWVRDPVGNTTAESIDGNNQTRTLNTLHAPVASGNKNFAYDVNGQMTRKNDLDLIWDVRNQLVTTKDTAHSEKEATPYQYDAIGNRISKGGTRYLIVDGQVIAEFTGNEVKQFVHGKYIDDVIVQKTSSGLQYFHKNRQRNTAGLTDISGNIIELYNIDATGRVKAFNGLGVAKPAPMATDRLFTGRVFDHETGLHYFRARYFEPELGSFISRDPIGFKDGNSLYQGWFSLAMKNDPYGRDIIEFITSPENPEVSDPVNDPIRAALKKALIDLDNYQDSKGNQCVDIKVVDASKMTAAQINEIVTKSGKDNVWVVGHGSKDKLYLNGTDKDGIDPTQTGVPPEHIYACYLHNNSGQTISNAKELAKDLNSILEEAKKIVCCTEKRTITILDGRFYKGSAYQVIPADALKSAQDALKMYEGYPDPKDQRTRDYIEYLKKEIQRLQEITNTYNPIFG